MFSIHCYACKSTLFTRYIRSLLLLCILLAVTTTYSQTRATITGTISDQFGGLPGATVSIEGTTLVTTTDVNGMYEFSVDEGTYIINASFVMYITDSKEASVKVGETVQLDFLLQTGFSIDQPISIGTRGEPISSLNTSSPVDIITPQMLENAAGLELSAVLHYLVPSFHSTHQTIADGTDHIDPATLRGLGPDQVLVLINGKRRHSSSLLNVNGTVGRGSVGIDFNAIPLATIERIEILREGATSQYGSDAIAGVINIILKKQTEVIDIDNRVLINSEGDGLRMISLVKQDMMTDRLWRSEMQKRKTWHSILMANLKCLLMLLFIYMEEGIIEKEKQKGFIDFQKMKIELCYHFFQMVFRQKY